MRAAVLSALVLLSGLAAFAPAAGAHTVQCTWPYQPGCIVDCFTTHGGTAPPHACGLERPPIEASSASNPLKVQSCHPPSFGVAVWVGSTQVLRCLP